MLRTVTAQGMFAELEPKKGCTRGGVWGGGACYIAKCCPLMFGLSL